MTTDKASALPFAPESGPVIGRGGHSDDYPLSALVTGAARRIGKAIALDLAEQGWAVAIHYRTSDQAANELVARIRSEGGRACALRADLGVEEEAAGLVARAVEALGPLGLLINNASIFERDGVADATRLGWDRHMEPNLRAPFVLTQAFAAALPEGRGGLVVNLLDDRVLALPGDRISYSLSKAGLWALTRSLAVALAPRIRVVGIGPGYSLPEKGTSAEAFAKAVQRLPLRRSAPPSEICRALRFLITCKSITGQMIALDSGRHLICGASKGSSP